VGQFAWCCKLQLDTEPGAVATGSYTQLSPVMRHKNAKPHCVFDSVATALGSVPHAVLKLTIAVRLTTGLIRVELRPIADTIGT